MSAASRAAGVAGHTPLPWVIAPDCAFNDGNAHIVYPGPGLSPGEGVNAFELEYVAECGHGDRARADAELICRAVNAHADLLAALETLMANARLVPDPGMAGATDCYAVPMDDIEAARAALSKARGLQEKQK